MLNVIRNTSEKKQKLQQKKIELNKIVGKKCGGALNAR